MFRRANTSALITLLGTLTVTAAPLNPALKNTAFQPGAAIKPAIIKPAQASVVNRCAPRPAAKVTRAGRSVKSRAPDGLRGFVVTRAESSR